MRPDRLTARGFEGDRLLDIELARPLAADHQIAVPVVDQPANVLFGGDARVADHQRLLGRSQIVEHLRQRLGFGGITLEQSRAAHEATAIEHQRQGDQRTVGSLFLRAPLGGFRVASALALEVGVGQVIQGDRFLEGEEAAHTGEQVIFDHRPVLDQSVRGAVHPGERHRFEVDIDQLPQGAFALQPFPGSKLGAGLGHARDYVADHGRTGGAVESQRFEFLLKAKLAHGRQGDMLHAHRAGLAVFDRIDIDFVKLGGSYTVGHPGRRRAHHQASGVVLRGRLNRLGIFRSAQRGLATEQLFDARAQLRPLLLGQREMAPQVEQRHLAHLAPDALAANQAIGLVGLAGDGVAGGGAADEHDALSIAGNGPNSCHQANIMALHFAQVARTHINHTLTSRLFPKTPKN